MGVVDQAERRTFSAQTDSTDLLHSTFRKGERVGGTPSIEDARARAKRQLAELDADVKRVADPQPYPVGLEINLYRRKAEIVRQNREPGP
jgi:nicotinate phosphoribosyltransferase